MLPDSTEATSFWSKIWSGEVGHHERASWLEDIEVEFSTTEVREHISISVEDIKNRVSKMANWKAAGPDPAQRFWFKKLAGLLSRQQECLQDCICRENVSEWMVKGRAVLIYTK